VKGTRIRADDVLAQAAAFTPEQTVTQIVRHLHHARAADTVGLF
jgi:hypothetical protein